MQTKDIAAKLTEFKPGPFQKRKDFDPKKLLELAQAISEHGVINPPLVTNGDGYALIAGERRWRARSAEALFKSKQFPTMEAAVQRVAETDGPVFIAAHPALADITMTVRCALNATPEQLHLAAVIDNGQRDDLNPIEEALDFQGLIDEYGWSVQRTARKVGKSDPYVRSRIFWLTLEEEIQQLVAAGRLSKDKRVADALLSVPDSSIRVALAIRFAELKTKIAAIEVTCEKVVEMASPKKASPKPKATPATVPVAQAVVVKSGPVELHTPAPSSLCLCDECRVVVANLVEELCDRCLAHGLTAECETCFNTEPGRSGLVELVNKLMEAARC